MFLISMQCIYVHVLYGMNSGTTHVCWLKCGGETGMIHHIIPLFPEVDSEQCAATWNCSLQPDWPCLVDAEYST